MRYHHQGRIELGDTGGMALPDIWMAMSECIFSTGSGVYTNSIRSTPIESRQAKDSRDLIFGILGIIRPSEACLIQPDYTMSVAQVFATGTAVTFVGSSSVVANLDMLNRVSFIASKRKALPSWAVDFERMVNPRGVFSDSNGFSLAKERELSETFNYPFLRIRGCHFDTITFCCPITKDVELKKWQLSATLSRSPLDS
jgi:hypothetical protein